MQILCEAETEEQLSERPDLPEEYNTTMKNGNDVSIGFKVNEGDRQFHTWCFGGAGCGKTTKVNYLLKKYRCIKAPDEDDWIQMNKRI